MAVPVFIDHLKGERAGALDRFNKDVIRVGRNAEFELYFEDLGISYEHAELRFRDGDYWLVDRGSTNGSYVNEERAYNARLKEGDTVRFGKKGPVVRFRLTARPEDVAVPAAGERSAAPPFDLAAELPAPGGEPLSDLPPLAPAGAPLGADAGPSPRVKTKARSRRNTVPSMPALEAGPDLAAVPPLEAAPEPPRRVSQRAPALVPGPGVPTSPVAIGAASSAASSGSDASSGSEGRGNVRRLVLSAAPARSTYVALTIFAFLAIGGASGSVFFWLESDRKSRALELEAQAHTRTRRELDDLKGLTAEREKEERAREARTREEAGRITERLEQSLERERKDRKQAEKERAEFKEQLDRAKGEIRALSNPTTAPGKTSLDNQVWKLLETRCHPSIVLVGASFVLKKKDGTTEPYTGFGTGFFVSTSGHIVTNKHVVEPWKFRPLAVRIAQEELEVDMKSYSVTVWNASTRFATGTTLDVTKGYSTVTGNLEKLRLPPDRWTRVPAGSRWADVHQDSNEDLALLKATGGPFKPLALRKIGTDGAVEKLDQIMVLGFPAGPAVLEKGIAEVSPTLGQVRKVEDTISVSAGIMGGNSGGPCVDNEGRTIGVVTRVYVVPNGTEPIGILIKVEHVLALLEGS